MSALRRSLAATKRRVECSWHRALHVSGMRPCDAPPVNYVVEKANWSILWDGKSYAAGIEARHPGTIAVTDRPERLNHRIVHFGSQFLWELWHGALSTSNRVVVTYFHGRPEDGPDMARHVECFLKHQGAIEKVVTAASAVETRLAGWGIPQAKLARVPLGVDPSLFRNFTEAERAETRARFAIPDGALCIGSFQKDGVGWGDGMEPKSIKGPDTFVETLRRLARDFPVHALLIGPARGYVKAELERHAIPFTHAYFEDFHEVARCYAALDAYVVASREEGGPKALLESMATGTPIVTTRVGMADDLILDGENGFVADVEDAETLARRTAEILADPALRAGFVQKGLETAAEHSWERMALRLYDAVYAPMMAK